MRATGNLFAGLRFLCLFFLISSPIFLNGHTTEGEQRHDIAHNISLSNDDILGRWLYTVENVAYEYSKGALYITQNDTTYHVEIHVNNGTLRGQDVQMENNKITFILFIEGQEVSVTLTAKGDKLVGESTSAEGIFAIAGKRKPTPQ